jgi:hypothetical protein
LPPEDYSTNEVDEKPPSRPVRRGVTSRIRERLSRIYPSSASAHRAGTNTTTLAQSEEHHDPRSQIPSVMSWHPPTPPTRTSATFNVYRPEVPMGVLSSLLRLYDVPASPGRSAETLVTPMTEAGDPHSFAEQGYAHTKRPDSDFSLSSELEEQLGVHLPKKLISSSTSPASPTQKFVLRNHDVPDQKEFSIVSTSVTTHDGPPGTPLVSRGAPSRRVSRFQVANEETKRQTELYMTSMFLFLFRNALALALLMTIPVLLLVVRVAATMQRQDFILRLARALMMYVFYIRHGFPIVHARLKVWWTDASLGSLDPSNCKSIGYRLCG